MSRRKIPASTPPPLSKTFGEISSTDQPVMPQTDDSSEAAAFKSENVKIQLGPTGNTGTQIYGGYFAEEYLGRLRGIQAAKKWDEMRRSEAQISMLISAIVNPIKAGTWSIEPYKEGDSELEKHAELIRLCLFEMIDFNTFKHEATTFITFGFSAMEVVHSVEFNHPDFGTFNGLKALSFRSQKTINDWKLEPKTGRLLGVNQYTYSDLGGNNFIPGEFLLVFTNQKEGDNYEGISALRPMYGAYNRKDLYLKLAAIGTERYAIGTPIGTIPKGKEKSNEVAQFEKTLQNYTSHEASYIMLPEGWKIEIQKADFDADKIKELLIFENTEFANAVVANFLALGMNGGGGAYALGSNLGEFFTTGLEAYAELVCDVVNRSLIPNLIKLNYGQQRGYPKLKCSGISDKAGKELAETIKYLADARALDPDTPFKEQVRKLYKFPKPDPATAAPLPLVPAGGAMNYPKPGGELAPNGADLKVVDPTAPKLHERIKLADSKYVANWDKNKAKLKTAMQDGLTTLYAGLREALKKKYNSLGASDKILAAKGLSTPGLNAYKATLREQLSDIAAQSIESARRLVPNKKNIKLAGYDALPPAVRKLIDAQVFIVGETQAADLEKQVFFSFTSEAVSSTDIDAILNEVDAVVEPSIEGATGQGMSVDAAAGNALANVVQQSAFEFYFDPGVLDEIESFTFTNEDPISEICQELTGTTVAPNDPFLNTYMAPLHHNCKSRWVPNLKGDSSNPDVELGSGISVSQKGLNSITLSERLKHVFRRR